MHLTIIFYVNFDEIKNAAPKWYMGYSDNTNMTLLLATLCDTAAIYGPCAAAFGMEPRHVSLEDAMGLLRGQKLTMQGYDKWERESLKDEEHPYEPYNLTETSVIKYILPDGRTNIESLAIENNLHGRYQILLHPYRNVACQSGSLYNDETILHVPSATC